MSNEREAARQYNHLVVDVTEDLLCAMEKLGITQAELARRLNESRSTISKILDGDRNMTLRTLSNIAFELETRPRIDLVPHQEASTSGPSGDNIILMSEAVSQFGKIHVRDAHSDQTSRIAN
ncbi:MAG: helix-turn-helix transcriptional regulator [Gammaproteobacteria bacterium]|nr:helix-turn-helix transcriptional regulator [Gammaproteobacteria bacterium]